MQSFEVIAFADVESIQRGGRHNFSSKRNPTITFSNVENAVEELDLAGWEG